MVRFDYSIFFLKLFSSFSEYLLLVNTSGITLNIFGIVKEVATLLLAHLINKDKLTELNICGLVLCLSGMLLHGMNKRRQRYDSYLFPFLILAFLSINSCRLSRSLVDTDHQYSLLSKSV